jgi:hypothetical protein
MAGAVRGLERTGRPRENALEGDDAAPGSMGLGRRIVARPAPNRSPSVAILAGRLVDLSTDSKLRAPDPFMALLHFVSTKPVCVRQSLASPCACRAPPPLLANGSDR